MYFPHSNDNKPLLAQLSRLELIIDFTISGLKK